MHSCPPSIPCSHHLSFRSGHCRLQNRRCKEGKDCLALAHRAPSVSAAAQGRAHLEARMRDTAGSSGKIIVHLGSAVKCTRLDAWRKPLHGSARAVSGADTGMMKIIGAAFTGLCGSVATALLPLASPALGTTQDAGSSLTCAAKQNKSALVSQPNTVLTVTCPTSSTLEPAPSRRGSENIYLDANCSKSGLLSSVCPGGTVTKVEETKTSEATVNVLFAQLPASQQVVCLKCKATKEEDSCLVVITVAPASPRGPQVCAGPGSSVTLRINEAGGSAQFACGKDLPALDPGDVTKAYADDCTNQETLKDMSRSTVTDTYVTFKVDKLKKKRLCYLCKPENAGGGEVKEVVKDESCKIYVEVSGSTQSSSSVHFGFALPCLAAILWFT